MPKYMKKGAYLFVYLMLAISILGIIKYIWINIQSVIIAFTVENTEGAQVFTLSNFERLFAEFATADSGQVAYLINTFKYFGISVFKILLAFVVSYFLYKKVMGYKFFRFVFYLPCIISPIVLVMTYKDILRVEGPLWQLINSIFGHGYEEIFTNKDAATNAILSYVLWTGFGVALLIFVGSMNRIPESIIESGQIDGAGMWREFFSLVLPLAWETLSTMLLLTFVCIFTASGPILYFTAGNYETSTISFWIFNSVLGGMYNYPAAVGLFYTVVAIPFVWIVKFIMDKFNAQVTY